MSHKDEETFLDDVVTLMKAELSTFIAEVNNEKNDGINCPTVADKRFYESLNDEVFNFPAFIYYGIKGISAQTIGPATSAEITLFFDFLHLDDGTSQIASHKIRKKVMRCGKAMRLLIQKNFRKIRYADDLEILTMSPQNFKNIESKQNYKLGGIELKGTIFY